MCWTVRDAMSSERARHGSNTRRPVVKPMEISSSGVVTVDPKVHALWRRILDGVREERKRKEPEEA